MKERMFNKLGDFFDWLSKRCYCVSSGHHWTMPFEDAVCRRCEKTVKGEKGKRLYNA